MRILLLPNQFFPVVGGVENFLRDYAPALRARGHDVAVLTSGHAAATAAVDDYFGMPVFRSDLVRALGAHDHAAVHRSRRWIEAVERDWAPDVVHAHDTGPNLWAHLRMRDEERAPTIATIHASLPDILDPAAIPAAARLLEACDWVTAVSRAGIEQARLLVPGIGDRSSVIPNGVPIPPDAPVAPPSAPRVLCLGRLVPQKGFDIAIAAMSRLVDRVPGVTLTIGGNGAERSALEHQVAELGLDECVHFLGIVRHAAVAQVLDAASVVAMPSRFEGMPLVWLEAAVRARPAVATAVPGLGDVIEDGRTGVLVPPEDAAALAEGLAAMLEDPRLSRSLGAAAHAVVTNRYSMVACLEAYAALYQRIVDGRPGVLGR